MVKRKLSTQMPVSLSGQCLTLLWPSARAVGDNGHSHLCTRLVQVRGLP